MNDLITKFGMLILAMGLLYWLGTRGGTFDALFRTNYQGVQGTISTLYGNPPFQTYGAHVTNQQAVYDMYA